MVPDLLSSNLCSLRGLEDRFAFSVVWEINPEAEILSSRFTKTIIRSRGEFSYEQAQQRINDQSMQDNITVSLRHLNTIAKKLKRKRIDDGALVLRAWEVKSMWTPTRTTWWTSWPRAAPRDHEHGSRSSCARQRSLERKPPSREFQTVPCLGGILPPHIPTSSPWLLAAESQNIPMDVTSNKTLAKSLDAGTNDKNPFFNSMLRIMTTRCMMQALYFCSGTLERPEYYHYGLATPCYTHFTSPIRRYADIVVHRLLATIIEKDKTYPDLLDPKKCSELAQHINYRHKMAQYASRASAVITAVSALRGKVSEYEAYILFLHKNAIQVLMPAVGQQLTLYLDTHLKELSKLKKEREKAKRLGAKVPEEPIRIDGLTEEELPTFDFNEKELCLRCGQLELRPFDELRIQVSVDSSDVQHEKVVTRLVSPYIKGFSVHSLKRIEEDTQEL
ncbi:UNVERIFIED_CONTAM: hypothetical protein GTU68_040345, partial [Idotea baltica]|nr:hypothetical protein [Idotea baltica]